MQASRSDRIGRIGGALLGLCLVSSTGISGEPAGTAAGAPGRGAVAADHPLASACGVEVLEQGGTAADAAVATALCAGVVQPAGSGLGGGGFAVWWDPAAGAHVLDFREVAPGAAFRAMYLAPSGFPIPTASQTGGLAVAVPSESRGLAALLEAHGVLSFRQVAAPAIRLATKGFPLGAHLAGALERTESGAVRRAVGLKEGVEPVAGLVVRRRELAVTLRRWAETRGEDLATGRGAAAIVATVGADGGLIAPADLADYEVLDRDPIRTTFLGHAIVSMGPPSSGGIALAQMLRVLEGYDLVAIRAADEATYLHLVVEAMKHAYADRARLLGDPSFVADPRERLLSDERIAEIRAAIDLTKTRAPSAYGTPMDAPRDAGTQHISVLDAQGRAVALTTTINTSFGAERVAARTGVILNDEMDDFALAPGVPNAFGLVTDEANAIAPGKRPLSSMTPTVVLGDDGEVELVVGASGGGQIISATLQVLLDVLVFGRTPEEATAAPRVHHQWMPNALVVEAGIPAEVQDALAARGHLVSERTVYSAVQAVAVQGGEVRAGSDPRKGGAPALTSP